MSSGLVSDLGRIVGAANVLAGAPAPYDRDATPLRGDAAAVARRGAAAEVAALTAYCCERGMALVPRGGGTGLAGGAVPAGGEVVVALERLRAVRSFDPLRWRICVEAGLPTAELQRLARESGLWFPPDPGAAEQSQVGGNVATNAGGPHAFGHGPTGRFLTGVEAALAPGELVRTGGEASRDAAGYDLTALLTGSEGTLGIVTAAWLRLLPAPAAALPLLAVYPDTASGCAALERVLGSGLQPAVLDYLDGGALAFSSAAPARAAAGSRGGAPTGSAPAALAAPGGEPLPDGAGFALLCEAQGASEEEAARLRDELREALEPDALALPEPPARELWRWRDGVSHAVAARRGAKLGEDVAVPVERLGELVEATVAVGERHGLEACSWGHAGDGIAHANFLFDPASAEQRAAAEAALSEIVATAVGLGGTISGEHGVGTLKREHLHRHLDPTRLRTLHTIKQALDPDNLLNPGKAL